VSCFCEHDDEPSGSIEGKEFLDRMNTAIMERGCNMEGRYRDA
jgi:hypothetical protein